MRLTKNDKQAIVRAIMADVPKPDKKKRREELQEAVVKAMSPEARKLFKVCPSASRTKYVGELIYDGSWSSRDIIVGDVSDGIIEKFKEKYDDEDKKIFKAGCELKNAIESCSTLKQLNDRLPEFKKYFPLEQKSSANLPALTNIVANLEKLGWPKGTNK